MTGIDRLEAEIHRVLGQDETVMSKLGDPVRLVSGDASRAAYPFLRIERHETRQSDPSETGLEEHRVRFNIFSRAGGRSEANELLQTVTKSLRSMQRDLNGLRIVLVHPVFSDVFSQRDGISYRGHLRLRILLEATL